VIKVKKYFSLLIIIFLILSYVAFAQDAYSTSDEHGNNNSVGVKESGESNQESNQGNTQNEVNSKEKDITNRFMKGEASKDEMRAMMKARMGDKFSEEELQKAMTELNQRKNRKETFSYDNGGFGQAYDSGPSYEGYSKEQMIFGRIFQYIGDDIDPREIKEYCSDPNKIADIVIGKLKEKVSDLQKICSEFEDNKAKCNDMIKNNCARIGTAMLREGATEMEKMMAAAYTCPVNKDAIVEACKIRSKSNMEERIKHISESCEEKFDLQGERLMQECDKFKEHQICDKDKFMSQCMNGIKKEDFERKKCPENPVPDCGKDSTLQKKTDANGCVYYYCSATATQATANQQTCPTRDVPACKESETLQKKVDDKGCVYYYCQSTTTTATTNPATTTTTNACTEATMPTCAAGSSIQKKTDDRGCVYYYCQTTTATPSTTSNSTSITGSAVLSTYDNYLSHCENSWMMQQKTCVNMPNICDKTAYVEKCKEQEQKNAADYSAKIEQHCDSDTISEIKYAEQRCSKIDERKQKCIEQSAKRCEQMQGLAQECKDTLTEEKLRNFIVEEVKKRCKFTDIIENVDDVKKSEKAEVILAVLNTATQSDFDKLKLFVDNLEEDLKLQDTTVYKGTIEPSRFGDIKLLPFVVNAKLSSIESSARAKEVKTKIVAGQKAEDAAGKLVSLRDSDVPKEYLYIIEDKASDILNVSDKLGEIDKKEAQKGVGYKIRLFLGLAKAAEKEEIKQLGESKDKLQSSIDALSKLVDEVPSDVAKSILKEQVGNLKKQQEDIEVLIQTKEKKAKGLLGLFG